jgi:phenylpropionate dioxygenase-like ring-hydroxylating dioxygenase large terminal subunit
LDRRRPEVLDALARNAAADFGEAIGLPPALYHDAAILQREIDAVFRREWLCMGRLAEIPRAGDYLTRDFVGAPVVAIRQADGGVRAFANLCLHRSARLLEGDGRVSRISCPYHSWTYDIDGQLVGAPFMQQTPGFDVTRHRLREWRTETWQGFIYVCADAGTPSPGARLDSLAAKVGDYRMADYVPVYVGVDTWETNWKCLVENYMDAYHVHRVHRASFGKYGSSEEQTRLFDGTDSYTYHYVEEEVGPKSVSPHPDNTWISDANRSRTWLINIFPAHTMQLQPDMLWYLSILPDGVGRTSIRWSVSIPGEILDSAPDRQGAIDEVMALIHQVNDEDRPLVENVYRATASPDARTVALSYLERNVWRFGRYLAAKLCT